MGIIQVKLTRNGEHSIVNKTNLHGIDYDFEEDIRELEEPENTQQFYHVVSSPDSAYKIRYPDEFGDLPAKDRLKSILDQRGIQGRPKGSLVNKLKTPLKEVSSVSLSLTKPENLDHNDNQRNHFIRRASPYTIWFDHLLMQARGARPVEYLKLISILSNIGLYLDGLFAVDTAGSTYDFSWENEWRVKDQLPFSELDIPAIYVPDKETGEFTTSYPEFTFLPLEVLDGQNIGLITRTHYLEHLRERERRILSAVDPSQLFEGDRRLLEKESILEKLIKAHRSALETQA